MTPELKPCPFCGGLEPRLDDDSFADFMWCLQCGARGPRGLRNPAELDFPTEPEQKWNQRTE